LTNDSHNRKNLDFGADNFKYTIEIRSVIITSNTQLAQSWAIENTNKHKT